MSVIQGRKDGKGAEKSSTQRRKGSVAEEAGITTNWAAGAAWIMTLGFCLALYLLAGIENFFLFIPGWFIAAILYISGSMIMQRRTYREIGK